jgi:hypothetical protein
MKKQIEKKKLEGVGHLCQLCGRGIIVYVRYGRGWEQEIEYICCSNEGCEGHIKVVKEGL